VQELSDSFDLIIAHPQYQTFLDHAMRVFIKILQVLRGSVADPGCLSRIQFFPSRILDPNFSIPDPGSLSKNLSILTQKIVSKLSGYDPGCSSRIRIPDPGVKKAPDLVLGSATLIRGKDQIP
jgi:hypothetical protein